MTALTGNGVIPTVTTQADAKTALEALRDVIAELLGGEASTQLTIAGGVVTATRAQHSIETEGAAATDDLDRIAQDNHPDGRFLVIRAANAARTVVVKHNAGGLGTILLHDSANFSLNSTKKALLLRRDGTTWVEVDRIYGDKIEEMRAWLQLEPDTVSTAADRNITAADRGKVITLTGGTDRTFTFTASPAALGDGWECMFKNASTAFLTIVPNSGTIDGKATLVLKPGELVRARSDTANMDLTAARLLWRERLTANRTYYVRTDGNDANSGLVNSAGGAFLTIQRAFDVIKDAIDFAGFSVTVRIVAGTYTNGVNLLGLVTGQRSPSQLVFRGDSGTASDVVVSTTNDDGFKLQAGAMCTIQDLTVQTATSGHGFEVDDHHCILLYSNIRFGAVPSPYAHIHANRGYVLCTGNYNIFGGAGYHWWSDAVGSIECRSKTITLTGTPAFAVAFAGSRAASHLLVDGNAFSGSATGKRYSAHLNGVIDSSGAVFPGNVAGTVTDGGVYD